MRGTCYIQFYKGSIIYIYIYIFELSKVRKVHPKIEPAGDLEGDDGSE